VQSSEGRDENAIADPNCKALIFNREKIEAVDNELDDKLQVHSLFSPP
jgi:hypothetical protein